ncbi:DUF3347 domain-containing protein [Flavobacterium sandaracinum]|uniref:DUF3347 domain-containing protein n=1 Tax=Flavobacterium sandaracinum TaxID=2541733 RepID=A0A4R5D4I9_9FLAO|nr:DUF3347 domain-containing protein [Flavobacterium sandaracinum]TDE05265.1 DUF3347 domain-containing protein [Flavobacterium sandaracinum]
MKNSILSIVLLAVLAISCNQKNTEPKAEQAVTTKTNSELYACYMHPEITGEKGGECSECGMELTEKVVLTTEAQKEKKADTITQTSAEPRGMLKTKNAVKTAFPTDAIVLNYLKIKNTLTKDDSKGAAAAAQTLIATLNSASSTSLDTKLKNKYNAILADAKAHVKHIGDNADKIDHQRDYFSLLSKDVYDLIKAFGTQQTVYQDYCPMYGQGKTGYWISETKEVINPYFGSEMLNCGRRIAIVQ